MHMGTTTNLGTTGNVLTVHPHAHGDNVNRPPAPRGAFGSPPCTWGQRQGGSADRGRVRFTPMHMGTTQTAPRLARRTRFTPMHMGTTFTMPRTAKPTPVHPHAHGDNTNIMWPSTEWPQDVDPPSPRSSATYPPTFAPQTPARWESSTPEDTPPPCNPSPPSPTAYPAAGRSNGQGISPPSARSSTGSGPPAGSPARFPESARPCSTSPISGKIRSKSRVR